MSLTTEYRHRQPGRLALAIILVAAILPLRHFVFAAAQRQATILTPLAVLALLALLVAGLLFSGLTISVDHGHVLWSFGPGFFRRAIPVDAIDAIEPVRNPWLSGFGIRRVGDTRVYAVAGGAALELRLRDGRRIRLGTADPEGLAHAINKARAEI